MTDQTKPAAGDPADLPLAGLRIIDFSRLLPGPWCTQTLADMGADVIKIEQPDIGDYSRFNPPTYEEVGAYFNAVNRNKRSIALDLTQDDDYALARRLIAEADVVLIAPSNPVVSIGPILAVPGIRSALRQTVLAI